MNWKGCKTNTKSKKEEGKTTQAGSETMPAGSTNKTERK